jgi:hypothetical protein
MPGQGALGKRPLTTMGSTPYCAEGEDYPVHGKM